MALKHWVVICCKWYHRECVNYNKSTYKAIIGLDKVKWFCKECNKNAKDTLSMIQAVIKRMDGLDGRNAALEKRVLVLGKEKEKEKNKISLTTTTR